MDRNFVETFLYCFEEGLQYGKRTIESFISFYLAQLADDADIDTCLS
jgi:hypothetical protein